MEFRVIELGDRRDECQPKAHAFMQLGVAILVDIKRRVRHMHDRLRQPPARIRNHDPHFILFNMKQDTHMLPAMRELDRIFDQLTNCQTNFLPLGKSCRLPAAGIE